MKRVLFLTRLFYPHTGGIEKHIEKISEILIQKGFEISVITTKYENSLSDSEIYKNIHIIRFLQPRIKFIGIIYTWFWLLKNKELIKIYDIVHINDVFIWYWPFKILYPRKPVFTTFHGRWGRYPITLIDIIQKRIGAKLSDAVISIGDYIPQNYKIKSDVVTYGATDTSTNIGSLGKDNNLIVYVGRLDKDIALHTIFEFLKNLKGYKIVFCGDGELAYEANLYGDVKGFIDPSPYYKKAKYVIASGYLTVLESLAHKCLVFCAYDNPLQKDYYELAPFRKFIVCSTNPNELYEKYRYYKNNPRKAEKIISEGYKWVKKQTWEKMVENYLKLWEERKRVSV